MENYFFYIILDKMNNWKKVKINDIVEIVDGDRGKSYPKNNEFFDNEYCLFLNTKNVSGEIFCFDNKMFITKEKNEVLRKGKLKRGDYVLTTRGTIGNFAFYSDSIPFKNIRINSGMVILRTKNNIDRKYFGCYLSSQFFKNEILQHVSGSAQPQLPIRDLKICDIILPPLKIQQKIARVLGAYDSLIEINNRRIKILEEMAQLIYKEWFVKFKFPSYEKVKIKNGVPEGWEEENIFNICVVRYGKSLPQKKFIENGKYDVYGAAKIIGKYNEYNRENATVITGCRGTVGIINISKPRSFITNNVNP
ncbi:restriction endonuclease subunit S [Patescibacteria group bacterium]|nr:restriction endonuclease subunit S [Patescibacteria group bacterium]MBU4600534.1 restriction endonuclease subunit S [Patescibacteria group bacterium]MCG2697780.1 restriction endonuclease subunit S [Candidatus Parcubacteria bacterium]